MANSLVHLLDGLLDGLAHFVGYQSCKLIFSLREHIDESVKLELALRQLVHRESLVELEAVEAPRDALVDVLVLDPTVGLHVLLVLRIDGMDSITHHFSHFFCN